MLLEVLPEVFLEVFLEVLLQVLLEAVVVLLELPAALSRTRPPLQLVTWAALHRQRSPHSRRHALPPMLVSVFVLLY